MKNRSCWLALSVVGCAIGLQAAPESARLIVDGDVGYLLGAARNGQWIKDTHARTLVKGGESYSVIAGTKIIATVKGGKAQAIGAPCEETQMVELKGVSRGIAVSGLKKPWPRPVTAQSPNNAIYRNEVAQWLKKHGVKNPQVGITQIWRADLDGNGTQEVIINAVRQNGKTGSPQQITPDSAAGDYSVVLLRYVSGKSVKTVPVASEIHAVAKKFNAPFISEVISILDINGDGRMEIVLRGRYYEGDSTGVYEWKNGKTNSVLEVGCGA